MQKHISTIKSFIIVLTLTIGISYVFATWTGPTGTPPNNNASAPINVSDSDQIKDASLSLEGLSLTGDGWSQTDFCIVNEEGVPQKCLSTLTGGTGGGGVSAVSGFPNNLVCSDDKGTLVFNILGQQGTTPITYVIEAGAVVYSYYTAGDISGSRTTTTQSIWFHSDGTYGGVNAYADASPGGSACVNKNISEIAGFN